jgi:hypothetical protein
VLSAYALYPAACPRVPGAWCLEPGSNRYAALQQAADFKSAVSTNFTIEAGGSLYAKKQTAPARGTGLWVEARTGVEPI